MTRAAIRCFRVRCLEIKRRQWHCFVMEHDPQQLRKNRLTIGVIALGLFAFGSYGPAIRTVFHGEQPSAHLAEHIDRLAAAAEEAALRADRAAEEADRAAEAATREIEDAPTHGATFRFEF